MFRKYNGHLNEEEELIEWRQLPNGSVYVKTKVQNSSVTREYTADNLVIAVGAWLPSLFPDLPVRSGVSLKLNLFWSVKSSDKELYFNPEERNCLFVCFKIFILFTGRLVNLFS